MSEFQARKPRVTSKVVLMDGVVHPDVQPLAFGEFRNGQWASIVPDVNDTMYVGPDMHHKGADLDCLTVEKWHLMSGSYWCTPCAINEGVAIGIEYPPAVRGEAQTMSFRRAKDSVSRVREAKKFGEDAKPTHEHDCAGCLHLGNMHDDRPNFDRIVDLYFCASEPSLIARYGPSEHYYSGMSFIDVNPLLSEAHSRAVKRGLLSVEPERTQQEWEEYGSAMTDSACDTWDEGMDHEVEEALLGRPLMPNEY